MKKVAFIFVTMMMLIACSESEKPFNYRGLPLVLTKGQFVDSMQARGFAIDSAASDSGKTVVFASSAEKYRVLMAHSGEKIIAVQENYAFSTNDSTRQLWQEIRDGLEKELGAWPDCPILKDDHKVAKFDASDGIITVTLENTYKPTMSVRYDPKTIKE
ncbi:MAG: hypothetical protein IJ190_11840 [Prevotella sp.]|nr:hypothetical protein [Prevotella sp.]